MEIRPVFGTITGKEGEVPRYFAPHLFRLVRRKNRTVSPELQNVNWIRFLRARLTTSIHIQEFIGLWIRCGRHNYLEVDGRCKLLHTLSLQDPVLRVP